MISSRGRIPFSLSRLSVNTWVFLLSLVGGLAYGTAVLRGLNPLHGLLLLTMSIAAFAILAYPLAGFLLLVFISFAREPGITFLGFLSPRIALIALMALGILLRQATGAKRGFNPWVFRDRTFRLMAGFLLLIAAGVAWNGGEWHEPYLMLNNLLIIILFTILVTSWKALNAMLGAAFLGCVVVCFAGWFQFFQSPVWTYPVKRIDGYYGTEIIMALFSLIGACLGLAFARSLSSPFVRAVILLLTVPCVLMSLSAASRGVTVAAVCLAAGLVLRARRGRALKICAIGIGLLIVVAIAWDALEHTAASVEYTATHVNESAELSSGRTYLYRAAFRLARVAPLTGIGWGQFKYRWFSAAPAPFLRAEGIPELNVHCAYLQILVELGLIGLALYIAWTFSYFSVARQVVTTLRARPGMWNQRQALIILGIIYAIAGLLIHSVFDNVARGMDRGHILLVGALIIAGHLTAAGRSDVASKS